MLSFSIFTAIVSTLLLHPLSAHGAALGTSSDSVIPGSFSNASSLLFKRDAAEEHKSYKFEKSMDDFLDVMPKERVDAWIDYFKGTRTSVKPTSTDSRETFKQYFRVISGFNKEYNGNYVKEETNTAALTENKEAELLNIKFDLTRVEIEEQVDFDFFLKYLTEIDPKQHVKLFNFMLMRFPPEALIDGTPQLTAKNPTKGKLGQKEKTFIIDTFRGLQVFQKKSMVSLLFTISPEAVTSRADYGTSNASKANSQSAQLVEA